MLNYLGHCHPLKVALFFGMLFILQMGGQYYLWVDKALKKEICVCQQHQVFQHEISFLKRQINRHRLYLTKSRSNMERLGVIESRWDKECEVAHLLKQNSCVMESVQIVADKQRQLSLSAEGSFKSIYDLLDHCSQHPFVGITSLLIQKMGSSSMLMIHLKMSVV